MTPEQTLDWLAEQHKSQCNEDRPVQEWIRSMKSMLPAPVAMPANWFAGMTAEYRKEALRIATPLARLAVRAELEAAAKAEREACAQLCETRAEEEVGMAYEGIALDCAAAIRARGNP